MGRDLDVGTEANAVQQEMSKYKGKVPRELYIPPEFVQKAHVVHWSSKRCGQARIEEMCILICLFTKFTTW
jgi:hypothetical protein